MAEEIDDSIYLNDGDFIYEDEGKKKRKRRSKEEKEKAGYYLDPDDLQKEIELYYKTNVFTDRLGEMLRKIAVNLSFSPNFINYTYKDEMIGDAIEKMARAMVRKTYKVDAGCSAFGYLTTVSFNSFRNRITKEKKVQTVQNEYRDRFYPELLEDQCQEGVYLKNNRKLSDETD